MNQSSMPPDALAGALLRPDIPRSTVTISLAHPSALSTSVLSATTQLEIEEHDMAQTEKAILAGGCFWGVQDLIRKLDGVTSTRVGYTGGDVPNATYRNHGTHAEAIEIIFDPTKISYRRLL